MSKYTNEGLTVALINDVRAHKELARFMARIRLLAKRDYKEACKSERNTRLAAIEAVQYLVDDLHEQEGV